ncbi:MAG: DUF4402 domain-containing protein [Phenylobacterium sp.]
MTYIRNVLIGAAGIIAASALATGASAQVTGQSSAATAETKASIIAPIKITNTGNLDFGTIIRPTAPATDTVTITGSTRAATSGNAGLIGGSAATSATFAVVGEPARAFTTTFDPSVTMSGAGGAELVVTIAAGGSNPTAISGGGTATLTYGGSMPLTGATASGDYTGTLHVTVAYP